MNGLKLKPTNSLVKSGKTTQPKKKKISPKKNKLFVFCCSVANLVTVDPTLHEVDRLVLVVRTYIDLVVNQLDQVNQQYLMYQ